VRRETLSDEAGRERETSGVRFDSLFFFIITKKHRADHVTTRMYRTPFTVRNLSSSNITNLFTGLPRIYKYTFTTFSQPPSNPNPSPSLQPQPSSSTTTPPLTLSSIDKPLFDSILKAAHKEMDAIEADDLFSEDALSMGSDEENAEERAARKGKAKEESMAEITALKERQGLQETERKKIYIQEANEAVLARRGGDEELSDDE